MCGIAGIWNLDQSPIENGVIENMAGFLLERGPDCTNFYKTELIHLAHARLSIIDLSEAANQPLTIDENYTIVFNGEIYNFLEVKAELIKQGVNFRTKGDTEVILQAYKLWGIRKTLGKLNGMFAFAILDQQNNKLIIARDRFGQKPLYYHLTDKKFYFSSDIRSIWKEEKRNLEIDLESVDYFLTELSVPQPKTIWKNVAQLKPAHYFEIELNKPIWREHRYWQMDYSKKVQMHIDDVVEETETKLVEAVNKRTISDVPIGSFLSGGVDSGLITSILAKNSSKPIKTFTVGLEYEAINELEEARIVANKYETDHHEIIAKVNIIDDLNELIDYFGEPFADSSMLPSYCITKEIKKHVTVALSGDGGDEFFGGYWDYLNCWKAERFRQTNWFKPLRWLNITSSKVLHKYGLSKTNYGDLEAYYNIPNGFKLYRQMGLSPYDKQHIYSKEMEAFQGFTPFHFDNLWKKHATPFLVDNLMSASLDTRLLNDYLVKVDRSSMKNSLEVRSPFLDFELAQWSAQILPENKFNQDYSKYILKKIAAKYFDPNIFNRPKKGFGIPMAQWLKKELKDWVDEIIYSSSFRDRGLFNIDKVIEMVELHRKGEHDFLTNRIFAIICLEIWMRKFVD